MTQYFLFRQPSKESKTTPSLPTEKMFFASLFRLLLEGQCLLDRAEVAVVQRRFAQQSYKCQRANAAPSDQQESINNAEAVRLKTNAGRNQVDCAGTGSYQPGRLGVDTCGHPMNVLICKPIPTADVQSKQVRVQLFASRQKVAHVDGACRAAED